MKENVVAAIMGAVNAYIQQEEQAKTTLPAMPYPEISPWQLFGRQEMMRVRTRWQVKRTSR